MANPQDNQVGQDQTNPGQQNQIQPGQDQKNQGQQQQGQNQNNQGQPGQDQSKLGQQQQAIGAEIEQNDPANKNPQFKSDREQAPGSQPLSEVNKQSGDRSQRNN